MSLMRVRAASQLTLPADVRKALKIKEGDYLEAEIVEEGVLLKPVTIAHRKEAWETVLKAVSSVKDTKPKGKRSAKADEETIVREVKAHRRRKHA